MEHFILFDPCSFKKKKEEEEEEKKKTGPLTFYGTVHRRLSNYTFFGIVKTRGISWYGFRQH